MAIVQTPLAAAMNGIKGFGRTVREKRGFTDDVAPTLTDNSIDAATLEAMQGACIEAFPDFGASCAPKLARWAWKNWPGSI
jgi:hypothetical protein